MSILSECKVLLEELSIPVETASFKGKIPDEYIVIVPLMESFELSADDYPEYEVQEARLSLFCKGNYVKEKNRIVKRLLKADFTVTDRHYVEYEEKTEYHHYAIDVAKLYELEE